MTDTQNPALESTTSFAGFLVLYLFSAMKLDLDKVFKEKSQGDLQALLPKFRKCKTYRQRLDFWDEHHLHLQLFYPTTTARNVGNYREECLRLIFYNTWEALNESSALSIVPDLRSKMELQMFINWGKDRRKQMYPWIHNYYNRVYDTWKIDNSPHPITLDDVSFPNHRYGELLLRAEHHLAILKQAAFHLEFYRYIYPQRIPRFTLEFEQMKERYLNRLNQSLDKDDLHRRAVEKAKREYFYPSEMEEAPLDYILSHVHEEVNSLNIHLFDRLIEVLKDGDDPILVLAKYQHTLSTWTGIDTYIFAETMAYYRAFIKNFDLSNYLSNHNPVPCTLKSDYKEQARSEKDASNPSLKRIALLYHFLDIAIPTIEEGDKIALEYGFNSGKKLKQHRSTYSSYSERTGLGKEFKENGTESKKSFRSRVDDFKWVISQLHKLNRHEAATKADKELSELKQNHKQFIV